MKIMELRDYQKLVINHFINNNTDTLYCLPTGTGKSVLIDYIIKDYVKKGLKLGIVVPSIELYKNIEDYIKSGDKFESWLGVSNFQSMYSDYISHNRQIYLGVYKSFYNKRELLPKLDLLISDECHHAASKTWLELMKVARRNIGFSATPARFDGKELPYNVIYEPYTIDWYMEREYLCGDINEYVGKRLIFEKTRIDNLAKQWESAKQYHHGDVIKDWIKYGKDKTIVYAINIEHCYQLAKEFSIVTTAEVLHSKIGFKERENILNRFKNGDTKVIINVNILLEGVNIPECNCIQFARYFGSIAGYVQAIGRALRPAANKSVSVIDNAGNIGHGSIKYFSDWYSIYQESIKKRGVEYITEEITPKGNKGERTEKPLGSRELALLNISRFDNALLSAYKKKSGKDVVNFWIKYMAKYTVNPDEYNIIVECCSNFMSKSKASRLLNDSIT